jgi:hypothetical protein
MKKSDREIFIKYEKLDTGGIIQVFLEWTFVEIRHWFYCCLQAGREADQICPQAEACALSSRNANRR